MGNAQALRGDEGRDKLRKVTGNGTHILIRKYPNRETWLFEEQSSILVWKQTRRTETSKYPEEEKTIVIPVVAASELGIAQTNFVTAKLGLQDYIGSCAIEVEYTGKYNYKG